jgi:hypothetical protein
VNQQIRIGYRDGNSPLGMVVAAAAILTIALIAPAQHWRQLIIASVRMTRV